MKMKLQCNMTIYSLWLTNSEMTPSDPDLLVFTSLYNSFPVTANGTCDMLLPDRMWQRWWNVTSIMLYKTLYRQASFHCFILLSFADKNHIFCKLKICGNTVSSRLTALFFQQHLFSLYLWVAFW